MANKRQPNTVLIVSDDHGYADLSGLPWSAADVRTPGLERLCREGTFFTQGYATSPICSPARTGLITGRYQERWGNYWFGQGGLPSTERALPQVLKEVGYSTAKIGKTHHNGGDAEHPLKHGFDYFLGFIDHTHDYVRLSNRDVEQYGVANARKAHIGPLYRNEEKVSYEGPEDPYTTDVFTDEAIRFIQDAPPPLLVNSSRGFGRALCWTRYAVTRCVGPAGESPAPATVAPAG